MIARPRDLIEAAEQAALNNALWCDAVCRANGVAGEFHESIWVNRHIVPPFYSNAVSLTAVGGAEQLARISELAAERRTFSVKDSFAALDLRPLGFDILFEATWLWRAADVAAPIAPPGLAWSAVIDEAGLARWEAAWAGLHVGQLIPDSERIFRSPLLAEPGLAFIAGSRADEIVAVAATNLTGDVVGLSNVFAPDADAAACWAGVVAFIGGLFPGRSLVGYERGDDLARAGSVGFERIGDLRVWARN